MGGSMKDRIAAKTAAAAKGGDAPAIKVVKTTSLKNSSDSGIAV